MMWSYYWSKTVILMLIPIYVTDKVREFEEVKSYALNHIHNFGSPNQFLVPEESRRVES